MVTTFNCQHNFADTIARNSKTSLHDQQMGIRNSLKFEERYSNYNFVCKNLEYPSALVE
jgi:hypothetical protein